MTALVPARRDACPTEQVHGVDAWFRDPSGNHIRLTEVREVLGSTSCSKFYRSFV